MRKPRHEYNDRCGNAEDMLGINKRFQRLGQMRNIHDAIEATGKLCECAMIVMLRLITRFIAFTLASSIAPSH